MTIRSIIGAGGGMLPERGDGIPINLVVGEQVITRDGKIYAVAQDDRGRYWRYIGKAERPTLAEYIERLNAEAQE